MHWQNFNIRRFIRRALVYTLLAIVVDLFIEFPMEIWIFRTFPYSLNFVIAVGFSILLGASGGALALFLAYKKELTYCG